MLRITWGHGNRKVLFLIGKKNLTNFPQGSLYLRHGLLQPLPAERISERAVGPFVLFRTLFFALFLAILSGHGYNVRDFPNA